MATVKISALTAASSAADADLVPIVQGGVTKRSTVGQLRAVPTTVGGVITSSGSALQQPANVLAGSGFVSVGGTVAAAGALRLANAGLIAARNAANSADISLLSADASDNTVIGAAGAKKTSFTFGGSQMAHIDGNKNGLGLFGGNGSDYVASLGPMPGFATSNAGLWLLANLATAPTSANVSIYSNGSQTIINVPIAGQYIGFLDAGASYIAQLDTTSFRVGSPQIGLSTAWGAVDGVGTQAMADANQSPAASVYKFRTIKTTGALTANRNLTLPAATDAQAYPKTIRNTCTGAFSVVVTTGAGTTVTIANGKTAIVTVDSGGVNRDTADA